MDFGIARAAAETTSDLTGMFTVIGKAHYLSPEQARGERVDQRSDLYSTGTACSTSCCWVGHRSWGRLLGQRGLPAGTRDGGAAERGGPQG